MVVLFLWIKLGVIHCNYQAYRKTCEGFIESERKRNYIPFKGVEGVRPLGMSGGTMADNFNFA